MMPFKDWLIKQGKAENTIKSYQKAVSYFGKWYLEEYKTKIDFKMIEPLDMEQWKNYLINKQRKNNGDPLAIRTINNYIESIKTYFRYLENIDEIKSNPADSITSENINLKYVPRWLDDKERQLVLSEIDDLELKLRNPWLYTRNRLIVYLSLFGGLRISEMITLTITDIKDSYIQIRTVKENGRNVPINRHLSCAIQEWKVERDKKEPITNALLISQKGGALTVSGIYSFFERLSKSTGIGELTPYTLRNTYALDLINKNEPFKRVGYLLGHSDYDTTRVYTSLKKK